MIDMILKTIPLDVAKYQSLVRDTPEARERRVREHMARVHPMLDAIREEERRVNRELGDPEDRKRRNSNKWKQRHRAKLRALRVAAEKNLNWFGG